MYKKEAAAAVATAVSGIWSQYAITHNSVFVGIVAALVCGYWFMEMITTEKFR